jgi:VanZ family protein
VLWTKSHIIALLIIGAVLFAMYKFTGLKIWHAVVVLAIGAYLTAFIFGPQITAFLSKVPALFGH